jgi:predicted chitinase/surface antigen
MNEQQIQELAKTLNVDPIILSQIYQRYNPKNETELIKLFNDISAIQSESNLPDISQAIQQHQVQNSPVTPQSVNFEDFFNQGYQFTRNSIDDLIGQCAWFAEQITRLGNGSNWTIGNSIGEKKQQLQQHVSEGNGFLPGQAQPEVGNSIVMDTGTKYGHVAVISEVLPDKRLRLTESNWNGDLKVSHDRIVEPNDKSIVGFVKSKPTSEFKAGPAKTDPKTPTTPIKRQVQFTAPKDKQELPRELQTVKVDDIKVNNPNVVKLSQDTGLPPEQLSSIIESTKDKLSSDLPTQILQVKERVASPQPGPNPSPTSMPSATPLPIKPAELSSTVQPGPTPMSGPAPVPNLPQKPQILGTETQSPPTPQATPQAQAIQQVSDRVLSLLPESQREAAKTAIPYITKALQDEGILTPKTLGYALATASHESGFVPKEEIMAQFGKNARNNYIAGLQQNYDGGTDYRGRGFIQLTHKSNYDKFGKRIGEDLVTNPDRLLDPVVSSKVLAAYMKDNGVVDAVEKGDYDTARVRVQGRGALNSEFIQNTRDIASLAQGITKVSAAEPTPVEDQVASISATSKPVETPVIQKPNLIEAFTKNTNNAVNSIRSAITPKVSPIIKPPQIKKPTQSFSNPGQASKPAVASAIRSVVPNRSVAPVRSVAKAPVRSVQPVKQVVRQVAKPVVQAARSIPKVAAPTFKVSAPKINPVMSSARIMSVAKAPVRVAASQAKKSASSVAKNVIKKVTSYFRR